MKKLWWIALVVLVAAGGYWWYATRTDTNSSDQMLRRTAVVRRDDLVVSISATGRIDPVEKVDVKSKASGEILELPIEAGDYIKKGDLIARLDRRIAQNDWDQAQADYGVAEVTVRQRKRELDRLQTLFDNKLASESELDNAKLAHEEANSRMVRAKAALSTADERLRDTEIRSPIDGIVIERPVEMGQIISSGTTTVTGGTLLCTVANMSQVYVVAAVDETDIGKVTPDLPAYITPDAFAEKRLEGSVQRIAPKSKVEQNVTVFEVTSLVDNGDGLLKAGMNATVEIVTDRAEQVLLIPARAVEIRSPEGPATGDTSRSGLRAEGMRRARDTSAAHQGMERRESGGPTPGAGQMTWKGEPRTVPMVQVRRNGAEVWARVRTGLSNVDDIEIVDGLVEGDTVVYSLSSGAMQQRAEFMERMRTNTSIPGMRRTN